MIRRFFPKGRSVNCLSNKQVFYIQHWMNFYPRAMLGWRTPAQLLCDEFARLGFKPGLVSLLD